MLDKTLELSTEQAVTASAASTNAAQFNGGDTPRRLFVVLQVNADFATCTSVTPSVQTDDASNFSSAETVMTLPTYPVASLTAGMTAVVPLPLGLKKYVRMYYTVAGSNATTGKISAYITDNPGIGLIK